MNNTIKMTLLSAALAAFALPVVAQDHSTRRTVTGETIQDRKENQQDRIANGVKSGELTAGETANLEKKESNLNQEEHDMRKLDNGKLTTADKTTLNQQQNQLSNRSTRTSTTLRCRTPTRRAKSASAPRTSRTASRRASRAAN